MDAEKTSPVISQAEVEAVIAEFNGDMRAAIAALLHDLAVLAEGAESASRGYARRDFASVTLLQISSSTRRRRR